MLLGTKYTESKVKFRGELSKPFQIKTSLIQGDKLFFVIV